MKNTHNLFGTLMMFFVLVAGIAAVAPITNAQAGTMEAKDYWAQSGMPFPGSGGINLSYLLDYKSSILSVINAIFLPVLIAVAFITFIFGVYKYFILGSDNEEDRKTGRHFVMWGIIGLVVIFSVWALVNIVSGTLGFPTGGTAPKPPML